MFHGNDTRGFKTSGSCLLISDFLSGLEQMFEIPKAYSFLLNLVNNTG